MYKLKKTTALLVAFLFSFSILMSPVALAKNSSFKSSSSSWSKSKSSYNPSKSVFDRKSKPVQATSANPVTTAKPVVNPKPVVKPKVLTPAEKKQAETDKKIAMEKASAQQSRQAMEQKKPALTPSQKRAAQTQYKSDPAYTKIKPMDDRTYQSTRNDYYNQNNWTPQPYAINHSRSSFGMWDAMFMWMMMDNINDQHYRDTYYHNQNSPAFREWRQEADQLAVNDAALAAKLAALDSANSGRNDPIQAGFVPDDIPSSVYAARDAVTTPDISKFRLGVGSTTGMYQQGCEYLQSVDVEDEVNFNCVNTSGSGEILTKIMDGQLDGGFVQADVMFRQNAKLDRLDALQATAYKEMVFMITSKDSKIDSIKDFHGNTQNQLYSIGGGVLTTMATFSQLDHGYSAAASSAVKNRLPSKLESFGLIAQKKNSAVILVCAVNCPLLKDLNDSSMAKNLRLVPVNDWDFNDKKDAYGNLIYSFETLSSDSYDNLIEDGWVMKGEIETMAVSAVFIASNTWLTAKSDDARLMMEFMLSNALPAIRDLAGEAL